MKMTVIPIVIDLGTVTKGLVQGLEDTTALLRSARILRRDEET